jgi:aminoglycoside 3-N-acetyltransferase
MAQSPYTFDDLLTAYSQLGVSSGRVVYVTSDLMRLMKYEDWTRRDAVLEAHFRALMQLLGPTGTLVVATGSTNLCNTDIPFDPAATPVHMLGVFSEWVRKQPGARRSFHPFVSYTAIGAHADEITTDVSRHAYGPDSPEGRMIELDALAVSVGLFPRHSCSTVHHVEHVMAVPYRYTKEFIHPVVRKGKVEREPFYLYVWYRDCGIVRSNTRHIFARLEGTGLLKEVAVGAGAIWSYSMRQFFKAVVPLFKENMYIWCEVPPERYPWRN